MGKTSGAMEGMAGMQDKAGNGILKGTDVMDPLSRLKEQTIRPETKIEYTIDLTRQYHNLLEKKKEEIPRATCGTETWQGCGKKREGNPAIIFRTNWEASSV